MSRPSRVLLTVALSEDKVVLLEQWWLLHFGALEVGANALSRLYFIPTLCKMINRANTSNLQWDALWKMFDWNLHWWKEYYSGFKEYCPTFTCLSVCVSLVKQIKRCVLCINENTLHQSTNRAGERMCGRWGRMGGWRPGQECESGSPLLSLTLAQLNSTVRKPALFSRLLNLGSAGPNRCKHGAHQTLKRTVRTFCAP